MSKVTKSLVEVMWAFIFNTINKFDYCPSHFYNFRMLSVNFLQRDRKFIFYLRQRIMETVEKIICCIIICWIFHISNYYFIARIRNPVRLLRWRLFAKIVNDWKPFAIFTEISILTGFLIRLYVGACYATYKEWF